MKNIFLSSLLLLMIGTTYGQKADPEKWESVKLKSKNDYKNAEPTVKEAVNYLLSHPFSDDNVPARSAARLVIRWMEGTKDYHFVIQSNISKYYTSENGLIIIYMAALAKLGFQSPEGLADLKKTEIAAFKIYAKYCDEPSHKVEHTAEIDKLIDAYKANKLESILDLDFSKKSK